jgi:hypothetical protein
LRPDLGLAVAQRGLADQCDEGVIDPFARRRAAARTGGSGSLLKTPKEIGADYL